MADRAAPGVSSVEIDAALAQRLCDVIDRMLRDGRSRDDIVDALNGTQVPSSADLGRHEQERHGRQPASGGEHPAVWRSNARSASSASRPSTVGAPRRRAFRRAGCYSPVTATRDSAAISEKPPLLADRPARAGTSARLNRCAINFEIGSAHGGRLWSRFRGKSRGPQRSSRRGRAA